MHICKLIDQGISRLEAKKVPVCHRRSEQLDTVRWQGAPTSFAYVADTA